MVQRPYVAGKEGVARWVYSIQVSFGNADSSALSGKVDFKGVHHVALLCENLERAMEFYQGILGAHAAALVKCL